MSLSQLKQIVSQKFPADEPALKELLRDSFLFSNSALTQFPQIELTLRNAKILRQGRLPFYVLSQAQKDQIAVNKRGESQILKAVKGHKLLALLELRPFEKIKILRNFPQQSL